VSRLFRRSSCGEIEFKKCFENEKQTNVGENGFNFPTPSLTATPLIHCNAVSEN
jgi:hypothetical protein